MNNQEMFDFTTRAIIAQGGPSFDPKTASCLYRGPNGRKCAAGHLISDKAVIEGQRVSALDDLPEMDVDFAEQLQRAHDGAARTQENFWPRWKTRLEAVAQTFDLDTTVLGEIPA